MRNTFWCLVCRTSLDNLVIVPSALYPELCQAEVHQLQMTSQLDATAENSSRCPAVATLPTKWKDVVLHDGGHCQSPSFANVGSGGLDQVWTKTQVDTDPVNVESQAKCCL